MKGTAKGQQAEILKLLVQARGEWVPLPVVMKCAAQYNARIFELRRQGFVIENRAQVVNGARHTWFRLIASSAVQQVEQAHKSKPSATDKQLFSDSTTTNRNLDFETGRRVR